MVVTKPHKQIKKEKKKKKRKMHSHHSFSLFETKEAISGYCWKFFPESSEEEQTKYWYAILTTFALNPTPASHFTQ